MIFPITLFYNFNDFGFTSFMDDLKSYKFEPKRTYFLQLRDSDGLTLGGPIPFSIDKPFSLVKKSGIYKPFDEFVKVEDVKVVVGNKVDDFDFIRDLYSRIRNIIGYVNLRDKSFVVNIYEDLPLNDILFVSSSKE